MCRSDAIMVLKDYGVAKENWRKKKGEKKRENHKWNLIKKEQSSTKFLDV